MTNLVRRAVLEQTLAALLLCSDSTLSVDSGRLDDYGKDAGLARGLGNHSDTNTYTTTAQDSAKALHKTAWCLGVEGLVAGRLDPHKRVVLDEDSCAPRPSC